MHDLPMISVIVPVYNVEAYLDKCISSIVNQTYSNLEIILVDDGSPDRSGEICDAWSEKDHRIQVIHQKNAGGGAARNAALDVAQGELIAFVDSDDYLAPEMFACMNRHMIDDVDLVECDFISVCDEDALFDSTETLVHTYTSEDAMLENIQDRFFRQLIWNKLYRREILEGVRFPEEKGIDDEFFTYRAIGNSKKLVRTDAALYAYRQQNGSVMHTLNTRHRLQAVKAKIERHVYIGQYMPQLESISICSLWFTCLYQGQLALCCEKPEEKKAAIGYLSDTLKKHPIQPWKYTVKEMIWLTLARISFIGTCRLRNLLRIGF